MSVDATHVAPAPPRSVELRDGTTGLLRDAVLADALGILQVERSVHIDGRGMVLALDELPDEADATSDLAKRLPEPGEGLHVVVALADGTIVGHAELRRSHKRLRSLRHGAMLSLAVHVDHQALGVGRLLMTSLIERVGELQPDPIHRLELRTLAENDRAIALYRSLGFEIEGTHRDMVRRDDGSYVDDHHMSLLLD